jgi:hypothetical protein
MVINNVPLQTFTSLYYSTGEKPNRVERQKHKYKAQKHTQLLMPTPRTVRFSLYNLINYGVLQQMNI